MTDVAELTAPYEVEFDKVSWMVMTKNRKLAYIRRDNSPDAFEILDDSNFRSVIMYPKKEAAEAVLSTFHNNGEGLVVQLVYTSMNFAVTE